MFLSDFEISRQFLKIIELTNGQNCQHNSLKQEEKSPAVFL